MKILNIEEELAKLFKKGQYIVWGSLEAKRGCWRVEDILFRERGAGKKAFLKLKHTEYTNSWSITAIRNLYYKWVILNEKEFKRYQAIKEL